MTRTQIIEQLFTGKGFNDCIARMEPQHLRDDLKMEVITVVCEWPNEKVIALHEEGILVIYVVRVIINMLTNKYSPFCKKYRALTLPLSNREVAEDYAEKEWENWKERRPQAREPTNMDIASLHAAQERIEREMREDRAIAEIDNLPWYTAKMLRLYLEKGNYRAMEKASKIPRTSCHSVVQKAFKELKQRSQ